MKLPESEHQVTLNALEPVLSAADLVAGLPGAAPEVIAFLWHACLVCLSDHNHESGVRLRLLPESGKKASKGGSSANPATICPSPGAFQLVWDNPPITDAHRRSFGDRTEAVEFGACAIAMLLILKLTPYTVIERSWKGTGFDYWLGHRDPEEPFKAAARLEVSGIHKGNDSVVRRRVGQKLEQTKPSDGLLPAYIVVSEFGEPKSQVVMKQ
jgi:hypothetical protein